MRTVISAISTTAAFNAAPVQYYTPVAQPGVQSTYAASYAEPIDAYAMQYAPQAIVQMEAPVEQAGSLGWLVLGAGAIVATAAAALRTPVNNIEYFPPNFEGLVLGCIDADFCK